MSDYENCTVAIWEVSYYLLDENGDDILNEDGSVKLFRDCGDVDVSTWAEWVEPEHLREVEPEQPNKEAKEVIEGLLKVLSHFEYLPNQYKYCLPSIEKAKEFLKKK